MTEKKDLEQQIVEKMAERTNFSWKIFENEDGEIQKATEFRNVH